MQRRPYAGVIAKFFDKRTALVGRDHQLYCPVEEYRDVPTYSVRNVVTGLDLRLKVPTDKKSPASLVLADTSLESSNSFHPLITVTFDAQGKIKGQQIATSLPAGVIGEYGEVGIYKAMKTMFSIMDMEGRKIGRKGLDGEVVRRIVYE
ncbi:MAG: hypothetical protein AABW82_02645 [Nanoarchaeota archaeon]